MESSVDPLGRTKVGDCWLPAPRAALSRELLLGLVHLLPDCSGVAVRRAAQKVIHPHVCVTQVTLGRPIGSSDSCPDELRVGIRMIRRA